MHGLVLIFLILFGCAPNSPKDFCIEGEAKCRELVFLLEKIETREDLVSAEPALKKKFQEMANLLVLAEKYLEKHPGVRGVEINSYNDDLLYELKRIYRIPGGKEIMEKVQKEPQIHLDQNGTQKDLSSD